MIAAWNQYNNKMAKVPTSTNHEVKVPACGMADAAEDKLQPHPHGCCLSC